MSDTRLSLIELVKAGDPTGWDRFIKLYRPLIGHWARNNSATHQDADDICQEVFRRFASRSKEFELGGRVGSLRSWLRKTTRFVCLEFRRKRGGQTPAKGGTEAMIHLNNLPDPGSEVESDLDSSESDPPDLVSDLVRRAIEFVKKEFSAKACAVFEMAIIENKPTAEVASVLGLTPCNVLQIKSRFLRRLRLELDGQPSLTRPHSP